MDWIDETNCRTILLLEAVVASAWAINASERFAEKR
jgi:hypothetical protein